MRWSYRFDETGGCDCLSATYDVYRGDKFMFSIEVSQYLDPIPVDRCKSDWELRYAPNPEAEALARAICQRMDGS